MKSLEKWQLVSFVSRGIAMGMGIIQGIFVARILTVSEYGMVGIVTAIGSVVGVTQHLGLASGSTREISAAKNSKEVFKIFVTSIAIRYCLTVPLALGLFILAPYLATNTYSNPQLLLPIRLFSVVLMIQAVQSLLNSVISGTQRFKQLFIYQALIAFVSVALYIPLIYFYKVEGYFYALLVFNLIASMVLGFIALWPLRGNFEVPSRADFKFLFKDILSISLGIYFVKVIYTMWQRSGPLLLGLSLTVEQVGVFSFALFYATKLMAVSDAVTDVNLPVLSKEYSDDLSKFKQVFSSNFDKIFAFIVFAAATAIYWVREIVALAIGPEKYDSSLILVFPLVFAFIFYSFVNIIKSSVIVPAKMIKEMVLAYSAMAVATVGFYFVLSEQLMPLSSMAYSMALGALTGLIFLIVISQVKLKFNFFTSSHLLLLVQATAISLSGNIGNYLIKGVVFIAFVGLYLFALYSASFITKQHFIFLTQKLPILGLNKNNEEI